MIKTFDLLIQNLLDPNQIWTPRTFGAKTLVNERLDIEIWMDNIPVLNTNVYKPAPMSLSLWQKFVLHKACKKAEEMCVKRRLEND